MDSAATATAAAGDGSSNNAAPNIAAINQRQLADQITQLIQAAGGTTEVVIALPDGTVLYDYNGEASMEAASLYKLGVMIELYRQREAGLLSFTDDIYMYPGFFSEGEDALGTDTIGSQIPIESLLNAMITQSSNVAASALLYQLGSDNVNASLAALGLTSTEIRWMPSTELPGDGSEPPVDDGSGSPGDQAAPSDPGQDPAVAPTEEPPSGRTGIVLASVGAGPSRATRLFDDTRADTARNVTTASDMTNLYLALLNGEVVNPQASQEMLDLLAAQEINDRLPALLPSGTIVAHKTGNLDGLVHDTGVIYAPAGPVIVTVLTEDLDEGVADDLIARIALAAYAASS